MKRALISAPIYNPPYVISSTAYDRDAWASTLANRGFTSVNVVVPAVRQEFYDAVNSFTSTVQSGDSVALVLLGHGSYVPGIESDGRDECYVFPDLTYTRDQTIGALGQAIVNKGAQLDVVSEFCYSGTSTDGMVRTWCACAANQTAHIGLFVDGTRRALFSNYMCYALNNYTYASSVALMTDVRNWMNQYTPGQVPQLDGPGTLLVPF